MGNDKPIPYSVRPLWVARLVRIERCNCTDCWQEGTAEGYAVGELRAGYHVHRTLISESLPASAELIAAEGARLHERARQLNRNCERRSVPVEYEASVELACAVRT